MSYKDPNHKIKPVKPVNSGLVGLKKDKMSTILNGFEDIGISLDFDNLRLLCGFVKQFLEREQMEFQESYDKKITEVAEEHKDEYIQWLGDSHWYLFEVFPSLQWMSLFNSSYAVFEKNLNYICEMAGRCINSKITVKDVSGQGIERAKIFLTKVVGIEEPFKGERWHKIKRYAELRNVLAHASGELDLTKSNQKQIFEYAIKHPSITVRHNEGSDFGNIALQHAIVMEAIEEFRGFIHLLNHQDIKCEAD